MFSLTLSTAIICGLASLAGGFMDAVSGGGGLLTITALLLCGVPPHVAIGTNKVGAFFGIAVAFYKFASSHLIVWKIVLGGAVFAIAGSCLGAFLALRLQTETLGKIILALLPLAIAGTFLPSKKIYAPESALRGFRLWLILPLFGLVMGGYDGFFGPGSGTFYLLGLHWLLGLDLMRASATTKPFNLVDNTCSSLYFLISGAVFWELAGVMAVCFMLGNWAGAVFTIRVGAKAVKKFLLFSLCLLFASLVWRYFISYSIF